MDKAVIIGAGSVDGVVYNDTPKVVICADGGYDNAKKLCLVPDIVIGDMDSVKDVPDGVESIVLNPKKDYTDMYMAIMHAVDNGYTELDILGALGTRFDHCLANVYLLKELCKRRISARIIGAHNTLIAMDKEMTLTGCKGKTVSILPLSDRAEGITLDGFEYPLTDGVMEIGVSIGISNVVTSDTARITLNKGLLLVDIVNE